MKNSETLLIIVRGPTGVILEMSLMKHLFVRVVILGYRKFDRRAAIGPSYNSNDVKYRWDEQVMFLILGWSYCSNVLMFQSSVVDLDMNFGL